MQRGADPACYYPQVQRSKMAEQVDLTRSRGLCRDQRRQRCLCLLHQVLTPLLLEHLRMRSKRTGRRQLAVPTPQQPGDSPVQLAAGLSPVHSFGDVVFLRCKLSGARTETRQYGAGSGQAPRVNAINKVNLQRCDPVDAPQLASDGISGAVVSW
jgi:DNA-binding transcriptional MocR family regulator